MEREVLRHFLNSGPTRKFDVRILTARARRHNTNAKPLFRTEFLNRSVIFKHLEVGPGFNANEYPIKTLIFLPYDLEKPSDGGESFIYSAQNLRTYCDYKMDGRRPDQKCLDEDIAVLDILNGLPALSPFLIEDAFDKAGLALPAYYLELAPEQIAKIKSRIRARLRPLVAAALPRGKGAPLNAALDRIVDRFLRPDSLAEIRPLAEALRLPEENASEILSAWTGITFFEQELYAVEPRLRALAAWFAQYSRPRETVPREERDYLTASSAFIRKRIREDWAKAVRIIGEYQTSYRQLADDEAGDLSIFIDFLHGSRTHYWTIGDVLGKLEQATYAWERFTKPYPNQPLPYGHLSEFYKVLCQSYRTREIQADALSTSSPCGELIEFD